MSTANITAFQDKVAASPDLQSRLAEIQRQAAVNTAEAIASLATETGTPFTADELLANPGPSSNELQDSELESVAGGVIQTHTITGKEVGENNMHNLWGLRGTQYRYTTDRNLSFSSLTNYDIGDQKEFYVKLFGKPTS